MSERTADGWNTTHDVGTEVLFWPLSRDDPPRRSRTRSAAWSLGSGIAVVSVDGYTGGIALSHVAAIPAAPEPRSTPGPSTGTPEPSQAASEAHSGEVARLREALERVRALFAGGPDTPCRTTWHEGPFDTRIECVEVPMDDLRAVLDSVGTALASVDAPAPDEADDILRDDTGDWRWPTYRTVVEFSTDDEPRR